MKKVPGDFFVTFVGLSLITIAKLAQINDIKQNSWEELKAVPKIGLEKCFMDWRFRITLKAIKNIYNFWILLPTGPPKSDTIENMKLIFFILLVVFSITISTVIKKQKEY